MLSLEQHRLRESSFDQRLKNARRQATNVAGRAVNSRLDALAMQGDVEAFALLFFGDP